MLSQRSSSRCKNRWAGLLRDGPSQRNYRGAVSSYGPMVLIPSLGSCRVQRQWWLSKVILYQSFALWLAMH